MANNTAAEIEEFDELEAMLSDMQDDVAPKETTEVDATADIDLDELSDDLDEAEQVESAIQLQVPAKKTANKAVEDDEEVEEADFEEVKPETAEKPKTKPKKASAPKFVASGSLVEFGEKLFDKDKPLLLTVDDADESPDSVTTANLNAIDAVKPVKVREKLANALAWVAQGKTLSKYTRATFELVKSKGEVSKADITNHLLDQGVNLGTASSQSGQMTHILTSLKIATLESNKFKVNPDSVILQMLGTADEATTKESEEISKAA